MIRPHAARLLTSRTAVLVSVAEVLERQITDFHEFTGRIEAVERVELRPRVSGYIQSVAFREGAAKTHVKAILTKLDAIGRTEAVSVAHKRGLIRL